MSIRIVFAFVLLALLGGCQYRMTSQEKISTISGRDGLLLDSVITPYIKQLRSATDNAAGLAIGVVKGNEIIYARTFGKAHVNSAREISRSTPFHIASVSKPFCAIAIAILVQEGKVKLDDLIVDLLPEFRMKGAGYQKITIRHILTHTSGIPRNIAQDDWLNPSYGEDALEENLEIIAQHGLAFEPGSQFSYSNSAFDLLGLVISRVADQSFASFVKNRVFEPLQMSNSSYLKSKDTLPGEWAMSHSYGLKTEPLTPYPYNERLLPSSGVVASLDDMLNWGQFHINKGSFSGKTILEESYFDLVTTPQFDTPWGDQIGLSWFLQSYLDRPIIMHTGFDTGFECMMYIYPEEEIAIVVMGNRDFSRIGRIINAVSEALFEQDIKPYELSARYKFASAYNENGIDHAKAMWTTLKRDTLDAYYVDDEDILTAGAILENAQDWVASKDVLEYYIELDRRSTYAWRLLGNCHLNLGDTTKALNCYQETIRINPDYEKGKRALEKLQADID